MKINAKEILELYPKIKVKGKKGKLIEMNNDLIFINMNGSIERITDCVISEIKHKRKKWIELKILFSVLIDKGIKEVEK